MAGKNTAAFGIYPNEATLRNGVEKLQREGFRSTDIYRSCFPQLACSRGDYCHRSRNNRGTRRHQGRNKRNY